MTRVYPWALSTIFLLGLAIRIGWGLYQPGDPQSLAALPDQLEYLTLGSNLLHGKGLQFVDPRFEQTIFAYRLPGYPAFVALCGAHITTVRMIQAVIDSLNILAAWLLVRRLVGSRQQAAGLIAALLVSFNPYLIYFSGLILSESLFTACLFWSILLLVPRDGASGRWRWIGATLLLIAGVYIRPSGLLLPILLPLVAIWAGWAISTQLSANYRPGRSYRFYHLAAATLFCTAMLLIALFPWAYRNSKMLGHYIWTTTNQGITAYDGWNPQATGASDQSFITHMPQLKQMGELERSIYLQALAREYIQSHPGRSVELGIHKIARTWSPVALSEPFRSSPLYLMVGLLFTLPLFSLAVIGLVRPIISWRIKILLLLPVVYFTMVHAASVGSLRYRVPVEPILATLAAMAVVRRHSAATDETQIR